MRQPTSAPSATAANGPTPTRRARRTILRGLLALLSIAILPVALLAWSLGSESGARWWLAGVLPRLASVEVQGLRGALAGDFALQRLSWQVGQQRWLRIEGLSWQAPVLERDSEGGGGLRLRWPLLQAESVALQGPADDDLPPRLPTRLILPLAIEVDRLSVQRIGFDALGSQPLTDLLARLQLQAGPGGRHRLELQRMHWARLQASGSARLGADAPLPLEAEVKLTHRAGSAAPASTADALVDDLQATLQASGPLARFELHARLQTHDQTLQAQARIEAGSALPLPQLQASLQRLDLQRLNDHWPHTALTGHIDAQLEAQPAGRAAQPLGLTVRLDNPLAGRWEAGHLPLRHLDLSARGRPTSVDEGQVDRLLLQLGSEREPAGQIQATGRWLLAGSGPQRRLSLNLGARLEGLQPARLHPSAPALRVGGPLALNLDWPLGRGGAALKSGDPAQPPQTAEASLGLQTELRGELLGSGLPQVRLHVNADATPRRIDLYSLLAEAGAARLDSSGHLQRDADQWRLKLDSRLQSFDPLPWWPQAPAALHGSTTRLDGRAQADLQLRWPPTSRATQPTSPSASPGRATPGSAPDLLTQLTQLRGEAQLQLEPSLLAGVALSADLRLGSSLAAVALGPLPRMAVDLKVLAAARPEALTTQRATSLTARGELDTQGSRDHWEVQWSSPGLQQLAPWWRLVDLAAAPLAEGDLQGRLELDGRWPRLRSRGEMQAGQSQPLAWHSTAARTGGAAGDSDLSLRGLTARWQIGTHPDDALDLKLQVEQLNRGQQAIGPARLEAQGRSGDHQIQGMLEVEQAGVASATAATTPAPATTAAQAAVPAAAASGVAGTPARTTTGSIPGSTAPPQTVPTDPTAPSRRQWRLALEGQGGWIFDPDQDSYGWSGRVAGATLQEQERPNLAAALQAPALAARRSTWVEVGELPLSWRHGAGQQQLEVGPGQVQVLDARLRLDQLRWARAPAATASAPEPTPPAPSPAPSPVLSTDLLQVKAHLEPLSVAPLLARLQPGFGWSGDLQIGGHLDLRATPQTVQLDARLERRSGDLQVVDPDNPAGPQRLGLDDLRLSLSAQQGQWRVQQRISGGNLGQLEGEQQLLAPPQALLPPASAPLSGRLSLHVAQLAHWGRWLPAGWRLRGQLDSQLALSGRAGAPELSGSLSGRQLGVSNLLQGVDWRDAELSVRLGGETARIEQLRIRAGGGELRGSGHIELGARPRLIARLEAERFAALQRVDRRLVTSGSADLQLDGLGSSLIGRIGVDEGLFDFTQGDAPSLADDVEVERPQGSASGTVEREAAPRSTRQNRMDLRIDLGRKLRLTGRGLTTRLTGEVRLSSPANRLALHGDVRAEDGNYTAYGQKLDIERGLIAFSGAADNPRLDILAIKSDLDDLRVGVAITGTAQNYRVRLFSDPEVTDTDKLSYLLLGRSSDGLGRTDLAMLQRAAFALVTGESDSPSLIEKIGLDQLSVRKEDNDTRATVVSLGKQLTRRWYLGYERGLNATTGTWQLIYRAAQRFTLRAQTGAENALDLIWTWKWGTPTLLPPLPAQLPAAIPAATSPSASASGP